MKVLVIANPVSGRRTVSRTVDRLCGALGKRGHDVQIHWTRGPGDAAQCARGITVEQDCVVVAGGDGTLNEVLNGLPDPAKIPLALLPLGTANMIVRELDLPWKPEGVAELVEHGRRHVVDMGELRVESPAAEEGAARRFIGLVSVGFDAMVTERIQARRVGRLGYRGYVRPALQVLRHYRAPKLDVRVDDLDPVQGSLVIVSNIRNYGGVFSFAQRARIDSGHLDVCVFPHTTVPALFRWTLLGLLKRAARNPELAYRTGRQIVIDSDDPVALEVDGDYAGTTPARIEIRPGTVTLLV